MHVSNNFIGLKTSLVRRELGISSKRDVQQAIEGRVIQNIAKDAFNLIEIITPGGKIGRSHAFIAVKQKTSTSLWNIFLGVKAWECIQEVNAEYPDHDLEHTSVLVDKGGAVAQISSDEFDRHTYVEIIFEGKKTGSLLFQKTISNLQFINGHLFGIGLDPNTGIGLGDDLQNEVLHLCEWDLAGQLVRKISLADLRKNENGAVSSNEDYFIISAGTFMRPNFSNKIFVLDFKTQTPKIFDLETSEDDQNISSIFLNGNHLIIGSNKIKKPTGGYIYNINIEPKISILNLITGEIEKEFLTEKNKGQIKHLIADKNQAYFVVYDACIEEDLWLIDLATGNQRKLLKVPTLFFDAGGIQISIAGHYLSICYPCVDWGDTGPDSARQIRAVIDLKTERIINKIEYRRTVWEMTMSFQSGLLLIPKIFEDTLKLYVENFYSNHEQCISPIRTRKLI